VAMTLPEIQRAIEALPPNDQARLAVWVADLDMAAWSAEIEEDFAAGGAGTELLNQVRKQVRAGESRPLTLGPLKS
jgi:hypothetical protein